MTRYLTNKQKGFLRSPNSPSNTAPHFVFFWFRVWCFFSLFVIARGFDVLDTTLVDTADDIIYIIQTSLFQLYLGASSAISGNVYGRYLSIALMIHNSILSIFIPATTQFRFGARAWTVFSILSAIFFLEAIFSIYLIFVQRFEINITLFKKVGLDPKINDAFATRKCLETFGGINVFISTLLAGKFFLPPSTTFRDVSSLTFGFTILTYIQQLAISVKFYDENRIQRIVALFLSFLKIPVAIVAIVWYSFTDISRDFSRTRGIVIFLFSDIILITVVMNYFLVKDLRQFGSGLKESLSLKTRLLGLS